MVSLRGAVLITQRKDLPGVVSGFMSSPSLAPSHHHYVH